MDEIETYISQFSPDIQKQLRIIRECIKETAPEAIEKISWGVPTYMLQGFLVQFAANKKHLGFYCSPQAIEHFKEQLKEYSTNNKNTIRFSYDQSLPISLIQQIVVFRIQENLKDAHK